MGGRWIGLAGVLWGAAAGCGAGASAPAVDAAEYRGAEPLNPRLEDGRVVHLGYDTHHPECFVFGAGNDESGKKKAEEIECPAGAARLKDCPGGVLYRSSAQPGCICVETGGEARRVDCPG